MTSNCAYNNIGKHKKNRLFTERRTADNACFASGGVTCLLEALSCVSSSVVVDNLVLRNPLLRQESKPYQQAH
jgi:hypothetical protein